MMDRLDHALNHRIEETLRVLGIPSDDEFHRPFDVGEHHRDQFAFALDRRFGCENLVREVRVIVGRGGAEIFRAEPPDGRIEGRNSQ